MRDAVQRTDRKLFIQKTIYIFISLILAKGRTTNSQIRLLIIVNHSDLRFTLVLRAIWWPNEDVFSTTWIEGSVSVMESADR